MTKGLRLVGLNVLLAMLIAFAGFAGMANTTSAQTVLYAVSGTVQDEADKPLAGATVTIEGPRNIVLESGADGRVVYNGSVPNGTYPATTTLEGYETDVRDVVVDGADVDVTITLTKDAPAREFYKVSGTVQDEASDPLEGATVTVDGPAGIVLKSDADGRVIYEGGVLNGTYPVTTTLEGYKTDVRNVVVDGANVDVTITLVADEEPDDPIDALLEELIALLIEILESILASGK